LFGKNTIYLYEVSFLSQAGDFKAIKGLDFVALVELDAHRTSADPGNAVGEEFIAVAVLFFLYKKILVSQEVFCLADSILGSGQASM